MDVREYESIVRTLVKLPVAELQQLAATSSHVHPFDLVTSVWEEYLMVGGEKYIANRVYVRCEAYAPFSCVGWLLEEKMPCCVLCAQHFSAFNTRSHCRACGNLICQQCKTWAQLEDLREVDQVAVCNQCCWGQELVTPSVEHSPSGLPTLIRDLPPLSSFQVQAVFPRYVLQCALLGGESVNVYVSTSEQVPVRAGGHQGVGFTSMCGGKRRRGKGVEVSGVGEGGGGMYDVVINGAALSAITPYISSVTSGGVQEDAPGAISVHGKGMAGVTRVLFDVTDNTKKQQTSTIASDKESRSAAAPHIAGSLRGEMGMKLQEEICYFLERFFDLMLSPWREVYYIDPEMRGHSRGGGARAVPIPPPELFAKYVQVPLYDLASWQEQRGDEARESLLGFASFATNKAIEDAEGLADLEMVDEAKCAADDGEEGFLASSKSSALTPYAFSLSTMSARTSFSPVSAPSPAACARPNLSEHLRSKSTMVKSLSSEVAITHTRSLTPSSSSLSHIQIPASHSITLGATPNPSPTALAIHNNNATGSSSARPLTPTTNSSNNYNLASFTDSEDDEADTASERSKVSSTTSFVVGFMGKQLKKISGSSRKKGSDGVLGRKKGIKVDREKVIKDPRIVVAGIEGQLLLLSISQALLTTPDKANRVDAETAQSVRTTSFADPHTLLGWQVMLLSLDKKSTKGLYVVTAVQTSGRKKRGVFRLSCLEEQDQWMKLMHKDGVRGYPYVPLRKIADI